MTKPSLREALQRGEFICAPGIQDMITAVISNKVGFEFVYASGYWSAASAFGLPDADIASYTQMLERVTILCDTTNASVIADADTGYGGLLNMHHTVRGFEKAGVAAIQIEDQEFPKKCGHTKNKHVIPTGDMVAKIKVACEARHNPETVIIARTDAKDPEGYEAAIARVLPTVRPGLIWCLLRLCTAKTKCAMRAHELRHLCWSIWRTAEIRQSCLPRP